MKDAGAKDTMPGLISLRDITTLKDYAGRMKDMNNEVELTAAVRGLLETLYPLEPAGQLELPFPAASSPMIKRICLP